MASRFWVGGTGTWDDVTTTHWAATSGGAGGASAPTLADDAFLDNLSGVGTVTLGAIANCRSLDCTGYTGTLATSSGCAWNIGDSAGGSFKLVVGMSFVRAGGTLSFLSTSSNGGAGWGITTAGKAMPTTTIGANGGKWKSLDAYDCNGNTLSITQGTYLGNAQTITCGLFSSTNSLTRTIDLTNCTVNVGLTGTAWNITLTAGLTFVATGSTINFSGPTQTAIFGFVTYNVVNAIGSGNFTLSGSGSAPTFASFNRTGTALKTDQFIQQQNFTVTGTLTVGGQTVRGVNRLFWNSNSIGTQRTVTATGAAVVIVGDVDFQDIAITGSPSWTNAGPSHVGDAGGNGSLITTNQTTPAPQTWNGDVADNWSTLARWTSRVPLPQDDVIISNNFTAVRTITLDMPRAGRSLDGSAATGSSAQLVRGAGLAPIFYGSITMSATVNRLGTAGGQMVFAGRGTHTITQAGASLPGASLFQGPGSTWSQQDAMNIGEALTINDGIYSTNNNSVTAQSFTSNSGRTRSLVLGTSVFTLTITTGSLWTVATSALTSSSGTPSIAITTASTLARTLTMAAASGISYGTITYTVANSPGSLNFSGTSPSITTLNVGPGRTIVFPTASGTYSFTTFNGDGVANGFLYLPGTTTDFASTPDAAGVRTAGDISIACRSAPDDWTPAVNNAFITKYAGANTNRDYALFIIAATGKLRYQWADGTTTFTKDSTVAPTIADGVPLWVMVTHDVDNGAGGNDVKFWTAPDAAGIPGAWTQLGTTITTAGVTSRTQGGAGLRVGADSATTPTVFTGKMYRAVVWSDITQTAKMFDSDFTTHNVSTTNWIDAAKTQFAEASSNAATVTINGALAQVGDGRVAIVSSTPGTRSAILSKPVGIAANKYQSVKDIQVIGIWQNRQSADAGNNLGISFNPSGVPSDFMPFFRFPKLVGP